MSRLIPLILASSATVVACDPAEQRPHDGASPGGEGGPVDADGDGVPVGEDCDDHDASVWPGADERCNGADDDCDGVVDEADAIDAPEWFTDADGDGHGDPGLPTRACAPPSGTVPTAGDCDDADPTRSPEAPERCGDGVDNDCDDAVDEGDAVDARTWYPDADDDGYGDLSAPTRGCEQPDGALPYAGDCDDGDDGIHPEAEERCDGVDEDCNGLVDDDAVDAGTWYTDADGDGHGDASSPVAACTEPSGATPVGGDCDDDDDAVHPEAEERCEDGVDNDCDGTAGACRLLGTLPDAAAATARWDGAAPADSLG